MVLQSWGNGSRNVEDQNLESESFLLNNPGRHPIQLQHLFLEEFPRLHHIACEGKGCLHSVQSGQGHG